MTCPDFLIQTNQSTILKFTYIPHTSRVHTVVHCSRNYFLRKCKCQSACPHNKYLNWPKNLSFYQLMTSAQEWVQKSRIHLPENVHKVPMTEFMLELSTSQAGESPCGHDLRFLVLCFQCCLHCGLPPQMGSLYCLSWIHIGTTYKPWLPHFWEIILLLRWKKPCISKSEMFRRA